MADLFFTKEIILLIMCGIKSTTGCFKQPIFRL
jgi:hypothetical protein